MSTNSKLASAPAQLRQRPFAKMPLEWHSKWDRVREFSRGIAHRLYALAISTGTHPPGLEIDDDEHWCDAVCSRLAMHPADRNNASRSLRRLREAGLLVFQDGRLRVLATRDEVEEHRSPKLTPLTPVCPSSEPSLTTVWPSSDHHLRSATPQNDSTHVSQIRVEEIREERETRAREISDTPPAETPFAVGHRLMYEITGWQYGHGDRHDLETIGSAPEPERLAVLAYLTSPSERAYIRGNPGVVDPKHVVRKWLKYSKGRPGVRSARPADAPPPTLAERPLAELEESLRTQRFVLRMARHEKTLGGSAAEVGARDEAAALEIIRRLDAELTARKARGVAA